jgi:two-component system chemotaxis sensor kinase CheA
MDAHREAFVAEAEEGITALNNALLELETDPDHDDAMDQVFRTAHTLKGNAGAMGYEPLATLAHALEDLLDGIRAGEMKVTPELMDLLFEGVDLLDAMVADVATEGETTRDASDVEAALRARLDGGPGASEPGDEAFEGDEVSDDESAEAVDAARPDDVSLPLAGDEFPVRAEVSLGDSAMPGVDALFVLQAADATWPGFESEPDRDAIEDGAFDGGFTLYVAAESGEEVEAGLNALGQVDSVTVTALGDATDEATPASESVVDDSEDETGADDEEVATGEADDESEPDDAPDRSTDDITSVRVGVEQLDDLYGLVEQLVTTRIKLRREMEEAGMDSANLDELDKISGNLQGTVMDMRLIPLSAVVETFPRMVRDIARAQDKRVNFEMDGTDIELDRTILTEIRDPLMHLLRNAVDHGIESPAEREAVEKDPTGSVRLSATRERDHVTVALEDDGGGLDADRIREKAVEKGIASPGELDELPDAEVYDLVFHPGFSTTEEVTDVSGRGVGMDVVHTTVENLDGTVSVDSTPGEGTRVELQLPVSLAIVKVLFVEVEGQEYGVPVKNIAEVSRADAIEVAHGDEVVDHDGDVYPVVRLREALQTGRSAGAVADGGVADGAVRTRGAGSKHGMLLRVRDEKRSAVLHCDRVVDQEEVVVKPLEGVLSGVEGISGTAVLGDGDVVPILDVGGL